ncbi:hypothetical protein C7212DRAFT_156944, partial [Tuber magnatum]
SIIETINAPVYYIHLLMILKGKDIQTLWFIIENIPDYLVITTLKGWTSNNIRLY